MGFFDRIGNRKYGKIGEDIALFAFSRYNDEDIRRLLEYCQFSAVETIRFKFDFFIVNLVVATHAINVAVSYDKEKAEKIIEPMYDQLDGYIEKLIPGSVRIGDFIVKDDEWQYLRKNHRVNNPDMKTTSTGLLDHIHEYRKQCYFDAVFDGFGRYMSKEKPFMFLGPYSPLVRLFVQNFPSNEKNTNHLIVELCTILTLTDRVIMEHCEKSIRT
jgi:hypothetical protein